MQPSPSCLITPQSTVFFTFCLIAKGQYQDLTVESPTGVNVDGKQFIGEDFDEDEIEIQNYNWTVGYNCVIIENSTNFYNCHGYAWHNIEGNMTQSDLRWINDRDYLGNHTFNVDKYYTGTNKAYHEIFSNTRAGIKVSYDPRDHSAVTDVNSAYHISKWAYGPLVKHTPAQCPFYSNAVIKLYELYPNMSGSTSPLCFNVQRPYNTNITEMPHATLRWTPGSYIQEVSGAGSPTYLVKGIGNGSSYVDFQISTPSGFYWTSRINFWAGKPSITNQKVDGSNYYPGIQICPGNHWLNVTPYGGDVTTATWTVPSGIPYIVGTNSLDFTFPYSFSSVAISARCSNSCGTGSNSYFYLSKKTYGCTLSGVIYIFPNTASEEITINIEQDSPNMMVLDSSNILKDIISDVDKGLTDYAIRIFDQQGMLLVTENRSGKSFSISVVDLKDGNYLLEVSDNKNVYREQLIVKHS